MTTLSIAPVLGLIAAFRSWAEDRLLPLLPVTLPQRAARRQGHVTLLGAGPGAADLITLRGLRALQAADVVFYDRLADPALLDHARPGAALVPVGKAPGNHSLPQEKINELLVEAGLRGRNVVRLKCGDPGIFGRGAEEAAALTEAGIPWTIVPGVTAACAAAASAQSFLTERGLTERAVFATGHRRAGDVTDWGACAAPGTTLACYMGVAGVAEMQSGLIGAGWPESCPVEVVSRAQTPRERVLRGQLRGLAALCEGQAELNPAILLIRWPAELAAAATPETATPETATPETATTETATPETFAAETFAAMA